MKFAPCCCKPSSPTPIAIVGTLIIKLEAFSPKPFNQSMKWTLRASFKIILELLLHLLLGQVFLGLDDFRSARVHAHVWTLFWLLS